MHLVICWSQMPTGLPRTAFLIGLVSAFGCSSCELEWSFHLLKMARTAMSFLILHRERILGTVTQPGMPYICETKETHHARGQKKPLLQSSESLDRCLKTTIDSKFVTK